MYRVRYDIEMCMYCMCFDKSGSHRDDMMDGMYAS